MHKSFAVIAVLLLPTASAQYNYDDYDFVELLTDAVDHVGFYDVTRLAVAETGDENLIFLVEQSDNSISEGQSGTSRVVIRFLAAGGIQKAMGFNPAFEPATQGAGDGIGPDSCENVSTTQVYCLVPYSSASASKGVTLNNIQLWSYLGTIADMAPDGSVLLESDATYTLTGCTLKDQDACPKPPAPIVRDVFEEDLGNNSLNLEFDAAEPVFADYTYNFTINDTPGLFTYDVQPTNGTVTFTVRDQFDELVIATVETNFTDALELDGFPGPWSLTASYTNFVGSAKFSVSEPIPDFIPVGPGGNETEASTNETTEPEDESTPGFAIPVMMIGLAIVALRRRD